MTDFNFEDWDRKTSIVNSATSELDRRVLWNCVGEARSNGLLGDILEIGSAWGRSALILSGACEVFGYEVLVHCLDIWAPYTDWNGARTHIRLDEFERNVRRFHMHDRVVTHRGKSSECDWCTRLSILFIDGEHSYDAVQADLLKFAPFVVKGGIILCHDYVYIPKVRSAVDDIAKDLGYAVWEIPGTNLARLVPRNGGHED